MLQVARILNVSEEVKGQMGVTSGLELLDPSSWETAAAGPHGKVHRCCQHMTY